MKLILLLLILNINPTTKVLEQGNTFVPLSDLDAYVYMLAPNKRAGFINDKIQIEKNLITILNLNIVKNYIQNTGLINHEVFNNVDDIVKEMPVDLDDEFYIKLGLEKNEAHEIVRDFIVKKEMFSRMSAYIKHELLNGSIENYLKEYFVLNKKHFLKEEKRDLSLIELNSSSYEIDVVKNILTELLQNDNFDNFSDMAVKYSIDESIDLNKGHLKFFRQSDFKYPFSQSVFEQNSIGVIPQIFKFESNYYLIRINEITPEVIPKFEEHRESIINKVLPDLVDTKLQNIINTQATNKVKVNPEIMAHVFERYKVLIEE